MELQINPRSPLIMHIDLNSCFAMIEQQANPLIRHKPVAVAAYDTPRGMVLAASYEAKALGIKLGVRVEEARRLCREIIVMMPDPEKYFDAHRRLKKVLLTYTDDVAARSVDEFAIDFQGSKAIQHGKNLVEIGYEIKQAIKEELGEYVTVNIGIATNRCLAKLAAGLHKPDGLDVINVDNLEDVLGQVDLIDLPGINRRYRTRLNMAGIFSPLQFLHAPLPLLKEQVFRSINGYYWYLRLRGHEVDRIDFGRKSFGHQYALEEKTSDRLMLLRLLMKLSEKTGRRLRAGNYTAEGIHLWLSFDNKDYWVKSKDTKNGMYSTQEIFFNAQKLLEQAALTARVTNMGVTVYKLKTAYPQQMGLFDGTRIDTQSLARASDQINDRYGEFTLVPATMANMQNIILKRVAFGRAGAL